MQPEEIAELAAYLSMWGQVNLIPLWYHAAMALTVRTDKELEEALDALVESEGLSRQEVIRRAVLERYERGGHAQLVAHSADRMLERWRDVLERLGSV